MPHVTGSSSDSDIRTKEITVYFLSGTSLVIPFGPIYPNLYQFSLGVLFRDEFYPKLHQHPLISLPTLSQNPVG